MPPYEFLCETCKKPFELIMTISEREKTKPTCPQCKGTKVVPQFGGFMAQTSKKKLRLVCAIRFSVGSLDFHHSSDS
jgi:putative FmdB family regulatory protein